MSENNKGKNNYFYGKTPSKEHIEKLKELSKERYGERHPMYGKHHSKESKLKMSESHKGRTGSLVYNSESVICLNNLKIYESMSLAELDNKSCYFNGKLNDKNIIYMTGKDGDNYFGLFWMKYDEYLKHTSNEIEKMIEDYKYKKDFRIVCLNNNTIYNSSTIIEEVFNFPYMSRNNIRRACNSKNHIYHIDSNGNYYLWMYYKDYIKKYGESGLIYYQAA